MNKSNTARGSHEEPGLFWRRELAAWRSSGLSQAAFQRKRGLSKNAFTYWKRKVLGTGRTRATFVAVPRKMMRAAAVSGASSAIRLRVAGGYVVELATEFETTTLERLLAMLERHTG